MKSCMIAISLLISIFISSNLWANTPPTAGNESLSINEDQTPALIGSLLVNNTDVDGDPLSITSVQSAINGTVENAFGKGTISLAFNNKALFNHAKCAGDVLNMNITGSASAVLNVAVTVKQFTLNGTALAKGTYNATTHPGLLSGTGSISVDDTLGIEEKVFLADGTLNTNGNLE